MSRTRHHTMRSLPPPSSSSSSFSISSSTSSVTPRLTARPLPPVPLLFSGGLRGGNLRVLGGGEGVEWSPLLEVGTCGLDRPLTTGAKVRLEAEGTGYFYVIVRARPFLAPPSSSSSSPSSSLSKTAKGPRAGQRDVIDEVKFKLKRSRFLIEVLKASRAQLHVLAHTADLDRSVAKYEVTLPHDLDPWVTFKVLFGDLRLKLRGGAAKNERPWAFDPRPGLNIKRKSRREVTSLHPNPCAAAVTERAITPGETVELRVAPHSLTSQTEVTLYLTHSEPARLKLHDPRVYVSERSRLDRLLAEVYTIRKFEGTLFLRIDAEKDCLEIQESPEDADERSSQGRGGSGAVRSIRLSLSGLDARRPLHLCVALLRASVTIAQRGVGEPPICAPPGYAGFVPGQAVSTASTSTSSSGGGCGGENEYLELKGADAYLTPIADFGEPPSYPAPAPPPPPPSPLPPDRHSSSPPSSIPTSSSSSSSSSSSPSRRQGPELLPGPFGCLSMMTPPSTFSPEGRCPPAPQRCPPPGAALWAGGRVARRVPTGPGRGCGPSSSEGPYLPMDGYVRPSRAASSTSSPASSAAGFFRGSASSSENGSTSSSSSDSSKGGGSLYSNMPPPTAWGSASSSSSSTASGSAVPGTAGTSATTSTFSGRGDPNYLTPIAFPWEVSPRPDMIPLVRSSTVTGSVEGGSLGRDPAGREAASAEAAARSGGSGWVGGPAPSLAPLAPLAPAPPAPLGPGSGGGGGGSFMKVEPSPVLSVTPPVSGASAGGRPREREAGVCRREGPSAPRGRDPGAWRRDGEEEEEEEEERVSPRIVFANQIDSWISWGWSP